MWSENFQIYKLDLEEAEELTRDQITNIHWITEKTTEFQKNIYFCLIDYVKAFDCMDHNTLWKIILKKLEYQTTLPVFLEIWTWVKK